MKRILSFTGCLFAFFIFFTLQNHAHAAEANVNGIVMTQEQYDRLKQFGFSDLAISQMDETVFNEFKDVVLESQSQITQYYEDVEQPQQYQIAQKSSLKKAINTNTNYTYKTTELTKEEYFKRVQALKNKQGTNKINKKKIRPFSSDDTTRTSYRRLVTSINRYNGNIELFQRFVWDIMPETRSYDVLTISIDNTFSPKAGSQHGQQLWRTYNPTYGDTSSGSASYYSSSTTWTKDGAGYGVRMNLKNDASNSKVFELEGYMHYKIMRNSSVRPYYINAYGNYSHAKKSIDSSFSYGLDFGGPSISWSGESSTSFAPITTHAQTKY
ncbi:hypothetical protein WD019_21115 [Fictibacillus sp. Mic-4]|uniref:hypothetical protein n=1 Tax=Fictibacillus sp. Mic-4 TaxID=3132826 RepID=UPI003CF1FE75